MGTLQEMYIALSFPYIVLLYFNIITTQVTAPIYLYLLYTIIMQLPRLVVGNYCTATIQCLVITDMQVIDLVRGRYISKSSSCHCTYCTWAAYALHCTAL